MISKMKFITIDPKILDAANGITYSKPKLIDRVKMLFGIKFKPKKLESLLLMDVFPRVHNMSLYPGLPKQNCGPLCAIGSVTIKRTKKSGGEK